MGADIKNLRTRIKSVDSTLHLTKAMGLVASSKIRKASDAMYRSREYAQAVKQAIKLLASCRECEKSPYMQKRGEQRDRIIIIAGDRGLAGGYNANIFRLAKNYPTAQMIPIGKRSCDRYKQKSVSSEYFSYADALALSSELCKDFESAKFDRLGIISTEYVSVLSQEARIEWILPVQKTEDAQSKSVLFEPDELCVLNEAVPQYVAGMIMAAVRESFACETAARRTAMDSAGKNAQQMIDDLQLVYNRARQGAITQEITEIVAGSGR